MHASRNIECIKAVPPQEVVQMREHIKKATLKRNMEWRGQPGNTVIPTFQSAAYDDHDFRKRLGWRAIPIAGASDGEAVGD